MNGVGSPNDSMIAAGDCSIAAVDRLPRRWPRTESRCPRACWWSAPRRCAHSRVSQRRIAAARADHAQPAAFGNRGRPVLRLRHRPSGPAPPDGRFRTSRSRLCVAPCPELWKSPISAVGDPAAFGRNPHRSAQSCTAGLAGLRAGLQHRYAVDLLDQQRLHAALRHQIGERRCGGTVRVGVVGEAEQ